MKRKKYYGDEKEENEEKYYGDGNEEYDAVPMTRNIVFVLCVVFECVLNIVCFCFSFVFCLCFFFFVLVVVLSAFQYSSKVS